MRVLVLFAAIFAVASAINPAAIYRSQCSEGASYWCQSASHADECGAVEYCIQNFWRGKIVQESTTCSDCEAFVNAIHNVLEQTSVQTEIIDGGKQACVVMGSLSDLCQTLVETLGAEVLQKLVTELSADEVCKVLQFCQEKTSLQTDVNDDEVCTLCKDVMAEANAFLSNVTIQQDVENMLLQFCPLLSAFLPNCAQLIQDEFPVVIQFLLTYLNPESCSEIGLCTDSQELQNLFIQIMKLKNREGVDLCSTCKTTIGTIDSMLNNAAIQKAIVLELDQLCYTLGPIAPVCVYAVNTYTKQIISAIVTYLNPDSFCSEFRFCPSDQNVLVGNDPCADCKAFFGDVDGLLTNQTVQNMIVAAVDDICAQLGDFSDQCKSYVDQYAYLVFDFLASELSPEEICTDINFCTSAPERKTKKLGLTADMCTDCKAFFGDIDSMLMNTTVQNMITANLLLLCDNFGSLADECKSYVNQYATLVYPLIASQMNPDQICATLQFCPAQIGFKIKERRIDDSQGCTFCKSVITGLETYVSSQANQAFIIQQLDDIICANLGPVFSVQCKSLVKIYTPIVINFILSNMDPKTICTEIKLCQGTSTFKIKTDPQFCNDCKTFLGDVDSMLSNSTFQAGVLAQIEGLCAMAGSLEAECKVLIETYGPTAFAFILAQLDPTTDCTTLGFCPATSAPVVAKTDPQFCSDCKNFLSDIDAILSNQTLENEILAQLEALCSMAGSLQAECVLLVKTYGPAAFSYILSELDPTTFCTEVGVCPGNAAPALSPRQAISLAAVQPMTTLLEAQPIPRKDISKANDADCDFCKTIVGLFLPYIESNATEEEVLNAVEEACDILTNPTLVKECQNYVHTYGSLIFELLKNEVTPEGVCTTLGECTSFSRVMASEPVQHLKELLSKLPTDDTFCTLCEIGVGELETILSSNKSKEEIKQEVEKFLCSNLPSPINSQCLSFMEIYGDVLVQLLIDQLEPSSFCAEIGLCNVQKQVMKCKMPPLKASTECTVCEFMISELDHLITENSTEAEIREALDKVCSLLPSTVKSECDSLVNEYTEDIVKYLLLKYNPQALCTALGICDAGEKVALSQKTKVDASEQCILCEYIMSEVDKILTENSTETEIQDVLDEVCNHLPSTLQSECTAFVNTYTPFLISYLTQELDPKQFCTTIGECQSANLIVKKPTGSSECALCEFVLAELDTVLKENATQEEIETALDDICDLLPSTVRIDCENFVNTYELLLIKLLVSESPDQICTLIALCSQSSKSLLDTIECDLCQTAVREFMITIQEPSVTKEIVAIINETCAILPQDTKAECYSYVDQYGDLVTQFIAQFFDPITTCTLLEACPYPDNSPRPPKQLLGQHECTRGPGYWCASMDNAKQCNMVEHCQRHVWN